jgi:hypothetical protein
MRILKIFPCIYAVKKSSLRYICSKDNTLCHLMGGPVIIECYKLTK